MNYFLTPKRLEELKEELEMFKKTKRLEVAEKLKLAKEMGDLSENSEYLEAREEQFRVEQRIAELEQIVKNAVIIKHDTKGGDTIGLGSTVELSKGGKEAAKFIIVGSNEARPEEGFISNESPLGRELIGRKVGDSVIIDAPRGKVKYNIIKIS